jgi:hypothetical protein
MTHKTDYISTHTFQTSLLHLSLSQYESCTTKDYKCAKKACKEDSD